MTHKLCRLWLAVAVLGCAGPCAAFAQAGPPSGSGPSTASTADFQGAAAQARLAASMPPLPANAPQPSTDPRNLEGLWFQEHLLVPLIDRDMYGFPTPLNAAAAKILNRRLAYLQKGLPFINASALCRPPGPPWQFDLNFPFQIFQSPQRTTFMFQEYHGAWEVPMQPDVRPATYMGNGTAHWQGDTLVIEVNGFKQALWLDVSGTPASPTARLTMRLHKVFDGNWHLEIQYTLDDPVYYTRPWSWIRSYAWRPDKVIFEEYNCEDQVGEPGYTESSGLVPEPNGGVD